MNNQKELLWPYSRMAAIVAIPVLWIFLAVIFSLTQKYANWPDEGSRNMVIIISIIAAFIPLTLVLLDYFRKHGAIIDVKGVKIDFARIDLSRPEVRRES